MKNQKGIGTVLILIVIAAVIGVSAVAYGIYITRKPLPTKTPATVELTENDPLQKQIQVGSPECPEVDYTGCDTSGDFMTWTDDGIR